MADKNFVAQSMVKLAEVELANDTLNIIKNFGNHPHTTEQQYNNFVAILATSKKVADMLDEAVRIGEIKSISIGNLSLSNAGAAYSPKTKNITFPAEAVAFNLNSNDYGDKVLQYALTFIAGHEIQHALNYKKFKNAAKEKFEKEIKQIAAEKHLSRDYTAPVSEYLAAYRKDEASAQIAGFNAVIDAMRKEKEPLTAEKIANTTKRTLDFVTRKKPSIPAQFKSGYQFNLQGQELDPNNPFLQETDHNLEISAQSYFDNKSSAKSNSLGCQANLNYASFYAKEILSQVVDEDARVKHKTPFIIAMQDFQVKSIDNENNYVHLPLDEKIIEENGFYISSKKAVPYIDKSTGIASEFNYTECPSPNVPSNKPSSATSSLISTEKEQPVSKSNAMARLEALTAKWDRAISAYESGNEAAIRASNQEMLQNPAIEEMQQGAAKLHEQDYAQQQAEYERMQQQQQVQSIGGRTR